MRSVERLAHANRWRFRHPVEKLLLGVSLMALSLLLPPWPGAALVLAAAVGCALLGARLPPADYGRMLALPAGFLAAGCVALAISVRPGDPGPLLQLDPAGLAVAFEASLRAMAATASLLLVVLTTPISESLALLRRIGVPSTVVDLMLLVYRFSALAGEAAASARTAQASRLGYRGLRRSIHSVGLLAASLLPRVLDRAQRMQIGLAARNWQGEMRVLAPEAAPSVEFLFAVACLDGAIVGLVSVLAPGAGGS